jgi:hypothetical protein
MPETLNSAPDVKSTLYDMRDLLWAARELLSNMECYGTTTDDGQRGVSVVKIIDLVLDCGQDMIDEIDHVEGAREMAEVQAACEAAGIEWPVRPEPKLSPVA